jgi:pimeloyl-ACP methyl ester carboxylesterase
MPEAMVNGVRIWYQETGEGDPVVQIHGAGFGHFNFATATPILSKSFRCIDFDMRGYGLSERPFQRYDMEVWADDVAGLMDHLGLHSAHIHGTSMGGMVAQQFAAKYPERTQRLIINCSAAKLDYAGILTFRGWIDIAERFWHGVTHIGRADRRAGAFPPLSGYVRRWTSGGYDPEDSTRQQSRGHFQARLSGNDRYGFAASIAKDHRADADHWW